MMETLPGVAWLAKIVEDKNHFVNAYVLDQVEPDGVRFQAVRKSTAALLSIWSEVAIPLIQWRGKPYTIRLVEALNALTFPKDRAVIVARNMIMPNAVLSQQLTVAGSNRAIKWQTDMVVLPEHWGEDIAKSKIGGLSAALSKVFFAIEIINLSLSVDSLLQGKGTSEQVWAAVGVVSSTLDAASGYGALAQWRFGTLAKIGALSAVIDTITAARQAADMKRLGDISATIGAGAVAGGSALITAGYAMSFFGAETAWTGAGIGVGIVGAILVATGYVISLFTTDTPLELFVAHSIWGHRYGEDSGDTRWSAGPFNRWHERHEDGLTRQIAALTNLLSAFSYTFMGRELQIKFGLVHPKTKVQINLALNENGKHYSLQLVADLAAKKTTVTASTPTGRNDAAKSRLITYSDGFLAIDQYEFLGHYEDPFSSIWLDQPYDRLPRVECSVRLDYFGDGSTWVPDTGKWVPFSTRTSSPTSSIDV